MNVLGLIPARAGSKRVPGKNLRFLGGVPLIDWTIFTARVAESLDFVVVSSEDSKILEQAAESGVCALGRPGELATDDATLYPVILHALENLGARGKTFDYVCLLHPTSPFRVPEDIDGCVNLAVKDNLPAVVSFQEGCDVPNGAVYVGRVDWLRDALASGDADPFDGPVPVRYDIPGIRSLDIDTEEDFARAEAIVAAWQKRTVAA